MAKFLLVNSHELFLLKCDRLTFRVMTIKMAARVGRIEAARESWDSF